MKYNKAEYYVGLLSAAAFYGATHQKVGRFQVITNKRIKHPLKFGQIKIEIIYKKLLFNLPLQDFPVATGYLRVSTPELIAFDLLKYPERSGGLNHIATILSELTPAINGNKLIKLAEQIGEKTWLQRFGYILERIDHMDENKAIKLNAQIQEYLQGKKLVYIPLASEQDAIGYPYIKKWKIIENTKIESDL
jgi:predicted transcriptional regulator of viral defense system